MPLAGRPMVEWSIAAFRAAESVGSIVVACPPGRAHGLAGEGLTVVDGGAARAESVANALDVVETELVAIHDAARPLVTPKLIEAVIETLVTAPGAAGAIAATPVTDTVKQVASAPFPGEETGNGAFAIEQTLDRSRLWAAQTPQVFWAEALRKALADPAKRVTAPTDEAMLVESTGGKVLIHPSPAENLKVTTPLDLRLAESLLADRPG